MARGGGSDVSAGHDRSSRTTRFWRGRPESVYGLHPSSRQLEGSLKVDLARTHGGLKVLFLERCQRRQLAQHGWRAVRATIPLLPASAEKKEGP